MIYHRLTNKKSAIKMMGVAGLESAANLIKISLKPLYPHKWHQNKTPTGSMS